MDDPRVQNRLALLPLEYREFVMSDFLWEVTEVFGEAHSFSENQKDVLHHATILYLLLFLNSSDAAVFIQRNCDVTLGTATELFSAIKTALPSEVVEIVEATFTTETALSPLAQEIAEAELQSDIIETEQEFMQPHALRTMARDMHAIQHPGEPTHSSAQSDILARNDGPRWDTEQ